jgi:hypothetical protein
MRIVAAAFLAGVDAGDAERLDPSGGGQVDLALQVDEAAPRIEPGVDFRPAQPGLALKAWPLPAATRPVSPI